MPACLPVEERRTTSCEGCQPQGKQRQGRRAASWGGTAAWRHKGPKGCQDWCHIPSLPPSHHDPLNTSLTHSLFPYHGSFFHSPLLLITLHSFTPHSLSNFILSLPTNSYPSYSSLFHSNSTFFSFPPPHCFPVLHKRNFTFSLSLSLTSIHLSLTPTPHLPPPNFPPSLPSSSASLSHPLPVTSHPITDNPILSTPSGTHSGHKHWSIEAFDRVNIVGKGGIGVSCKAKNFHSCVIRMSNCTLKTST